MRHRHDLSPPSVASAVGVFVLLAALTAHATYPGTSGRIAHSTTCEDHSSLTMILAGRIGEGRCRQNPRPALVKFFGS